MTAQLRDGSRLALEAVQLSKEFITLDGQLVRALGPMDLEVSAGDFLAIVGPSGCGKSTLFNIIAGLATPSEGAVRVRGQEATGVTGQVSYQLQKDLLLPWRTVLQNVLLGPEIEGRSKDAAVRERALDLLEHYGLKSFANRYPDELSGGMRQRTALVRTFLVERPIVLLDEPFGALDAQTRLELQRWLTNLWGETGRTVVLVTHDVDEAIFLADRVVVLSHRPGRIVADVDIALPRPRDAARGTPAFAELKARLLDALEVSA